VFAESHRPFVGAVDVEADVDVTPALDGVAGGAEPLGDGVCPHVVRELL
jgi:hypothetical protein